MKTFTATLNLHFSAISEEQALEIAKLCATLMQNHPMLIFNVAVEVDKVEEL